MKSSTPPALSVDSSSSPSSYERPKRLGLHESKIREQEVSTIAPTQNHVRENADESDAHDSCNLRAAEWLALERFESGLNLEEAASLAMVSTTTIWRRENGLVDLGPLKQLVSLKKARALRRVK